MEPRASGMLGKRSTTELHPQPWDVGVLVKWKKDGRHTHQGVLIKLDGVCKDRAVTSHHLRHGRIPLCLHLGNMVFQIWASFYGVSWDLVKQNIEKGVCPLRAYKKGVGRGQL